MHLCINCHFKRLWSIPQDGMIHARIGAPGRTRTDTGRILSPPSKGMGFQNLGYLSVTQNQILGILGWVYAFLYAF
jgi:hypothetical protein